jgi:putative addiction module killer protein
MYEIEEYIAEDGTSPFAEWLEGLKDTRARMRLLARLDRASLGNLGDWAVLSGAEGIAELRDHYGPGYRVYFSFVGRRIILLLAGSTKRDQKRVVKRARAYLRDYQERTGT